MEQQRGPLSPEEDALEHIAAQRDQSFLEEGFIDAFKGRGLFTGKSIRPSSFVAEFRGHLFCQSDADPTAGTPDTLKNFIYEFTWRNKIWCINAASDDGSLGRLANDNHHNPNCEMRKIAFEGKPRLCLFALRRIRSGEEITYDYGNSSYPWRSMFEESCFDEAGEPSDDGASRHSDSSSRRRSAHGRTSAKKSARLDDEGWTDSDDASSNDEYVPDEDDCSDSDVGGEIVSTVSKENYCFVCGASVIKICRHLQKHARSVPEIAKVFALPKKSSVRQRAILEMRYRGNFKHNEKVLKKKRGKLKVLKRNAKCPDVTSAYSSCLHCKSLVNSTELWLHMDRCPAKTSPGNPGDERSQDVPAPAKRTNRLRKLFSSMKQDKVTFSVQNDRLTLELGQVLLQKLKDDVVKRHLRNLGRLLLNLHRQSIYRYEDAILPKNFLKVLAALKNLTGFDPKIERFSRPVLLLKLGGLLKEICKIVIKAPGSDEQMVTHANRFIELRNKHLCFDHKSYFSQLVRKTEGPSPIEFTQDVQALHLYLEKNVASGVESLKKFETPQVYTALCRLVLAQMALWNKDVAEIRKLTLKLFEERSEAERVLTKWVTRINSTNQKTKKTTPILLTPEMVSVLELIVDKRSACGVNSDNQCLFARPDDSPTGVYSVAMSLWNVVKLGHFKAPQNLNAKNLKHIGRISQVLDLNDEELEQLAKMLGRNIRTEREYYRSAEGAEDLAKIAKLLMAKENGRLDIITGTSLGDVKLRDYLESEVEDDGDDFLFQLTDDAEEDVVNREDTSGGDRTAAAAPSSGDEQAEDPGGAGWSGSGSDEEPSANSKPDALAPRPPEPSPSVPRPHRDSSGQRVDESNHDSDESISDEGQENITYTKKNFCPVCGCAVAKLSRHIFVHKNDVPEVDKVNRMQNKSKERKKCLNDLKNRGNFLHNLEVLKSGEGMLKVSRGTADTVTPVSMFTTCVFCKVMHHRNLMNSHFQKCLAKREMGTSIPISCKVLELVATVRRDPQKLPRTVRKMYETLKKDEVAAIVQSDPWLQKLVEFYGLKDKAVEGRSKLREAAKLLLKLREKSIDAFDDAIKPDNFGKVVEAVKELTHVAGEVNSPKMLDNSTKIGYTLLRLGEIKYATAVWEDAGEEALCEAETFVKLVRKEWIYRREVIVTSLPTMPFTQDVQTLYRHMEKTSVSAFQTLQKYSNKAVYSALVEISLAQVLVLNNYSMIVRTVTLQSFLESTQTPERPEKAPGEQSELEQFLSKRYVKIRVKSKVKNTANEKELTLTLTPDLLDILMQLVSKREICGIPRANPYLFARPGDQLSLFMHSFWKAAKLCNVKNPRNLRIKGFCNHVKRAFQILSCTNGELQQLGELLGRDICTDRDYYQKPEAVGDVAKLCKLLAALENGCLDKFEGKSLEDIELAELQAEVDAEESNLQGNDNAAEESEYDDSLTDENDVTVEPIIEDGKEKKKKKKSDNVSQNGPAKHGRKKKILTKKLSGVDSESDESVPPKRGRKKKPPTEKVSGMDSESEESVSPKRGRKKKSPTGEASGMDSESDKSVRLKRGRKKKPLAEKLSGMESESDEGVPSNRGRRKIFQTEKTSGMDSESDESIPPKRGRKKRSATKKFSSGMESESEESVPPKRGQQKKSQTEKEQKTGEELRLASESDENIPPKRGRKKRSATKKLLSGKESESEESVPPKRGQQKKSQTEKEQKTGEESRLDSESDENVRPAPGRRKPVQKEESGKMFSSSSGDEDADVDLDIDDLVREEGQEDRTRETTQKERDAEDSWEDNMDVDDYPESDGDSGDGKGTGGGGEEKAEAHSKVQDGGEEAREAKKREMENKEVKEDQRVKGFHQMLKEAKVVLPRLSRAALMSLIPARNANNSSLKPTAAQDKPSSEKAALASHVPARNADNSRLTPTAAQNLPSSEKAALTSLVPARNADNSRLAPTAAQNLPGSEKAATLTCSRCKKNMEKGQTAFQRKGFPNVFCSKECLFQTSVNKPNARTCHRCLKEIRHVLDVVMAAVDVEGTIKDFCSVTCLCSFKSIVLPTTQCSTCNKTRTTVVVQIASSHLVCSTCKRTIQKQGKFYQTPGEPEPFCSISCQSYNNRVSTNISHKTCYHCSKTIACPRSLVRAPVDDVGTMKELCGEKCLESLKATMKENGKNRPAAPGPQSVCGHCQKTAHCRLKLTVGSSHLDMCSKACYVFCLKTNKLPVPVCGVCSSICFQERLLVVNAEDDGGGKKLCSDTCLAKFKEKVEQPQRCSMCQTLHRLCDMVESRSSEAELQFFCSDRCSVVFQAQTVAPTEQSIRPPEEEEEEEEKVREVKPALINLDSIKTEPVDQEYDRSAPSAESSVQIKNETSSVQEDEDKVSVVREIKAPSDEEEEGSPSPPVVETLRCSDCEKPLQDGATFYQREEHPEIFCSVSCLQRFFHLRPVRKTCYFCLETVRERQDVLQAPVDEEGTVMKDFCSDTCLSSFSYRKSVSIKTPIVPVGNHCQCRMCNRYCTSQHEVEHQQQILRVCSDHCFLRLCNIQKLRLCGRCHRGYKRPLMLRTQHAYKKLCSTECLAQVKKEIQSPQQCAMCSSSKPLSAMLENTGADGEVEFFCSVSCVTAWRTQAVSSSGAAAAAAVLCENCGKETEAVAHLELTPDASVRSFCARSCATAFREKRPPPGDTERPGDAASAPAPEQLLCSQCERIIKTKPEVVQNEGTVSFLCSRGCAVEFRTVQNVTARCEYCQNEGPVHGVRRVNDRECSFCSEGCQVIFTTVRQREWGSGCLCCSYCSALSRTSVTSQFGDKGLMFCSEECSAKYSRVFHCAMQCESCGASGNLQQSLSLLGEVKHFCELWCLLRFCRKKTHNSGSSPSDCAGTSSESCPVISNVVSLADHLRRYKTEKALTHKVFASVSQSKICGHVGVQTDTKELKNKSVLCSPLVHNKGVCCRPEGVHAYAQTDTFFPKDRLLPLPVPVYVPAPMNLYSQFTPHPVSLAIPVPVPFMVPVAAPERKEREMNGGGGGGGRGEAEQDDGHETEETQRNFNSLSSGFGLQSWNRWIQWRKSSRTHLDLTSSGALALKEDPLRCSASELSLCLTSFLTEGKDEDGESYSADALFYIFLCLQKHLFDNGRAENIFTDLIYNKFSTEFTKILQQSTPSRDGLPGSCVKEEFLWESRQLGAYSPVVLLNTMLFFLCKFLGLTTVQHHCRLSFASIISCPRTNPDKTKTEVLRFYPALSRDHQDSDDPPMKKRKKEEKQIFLEIEENPENPLRCPVRLFDFYVSKCPKPIRQSSDLFYLQPERRCVPSSPVWFCCSPLDQRTMEAMLTRILALQELQTGP